MSALDLFVDIMLIAAIPILIIVGLIVFFRSDSWKQREMLRGTRRRSIISNTGSSKEGVSDDILNLIITLDIEEVRCYSCSDIFNLYEEKCSNCGASRPKCMICYQDIKVDEKEKLARLPCCNVYVHEQHIISWLKQNKKCPNCRQNLEKWFKQMK